MSALVLCFYLLINSDIKQHQLWHFQVLNTLQLHNNPGLSEYIIIPEDEDEDEDIFSSDSLPNDEQMIFVPIGKIF